MRFIKKFEKPLLKHAPAMVRTFLEVERVFLAREDGEDVVRINYLVKSQYSGQFVLQGEGVYFDPEEPSVDTVDRVTGHMRTYAETDKQYIALRRQVISMLKKANLIDKKYKEGK